MNAYYLHKPDGTETDLSVCGVCGKLARGKNNFDISEKCCACYKCKVPMVQENRSWRDSLNCRACADAQRHQIETKRMDAATEVEGYDGPVYMEGYGSGSYGDSYFADVHELADRLANSLAEGDEWPEFAHCCEGESFSLDLESILEDATTDLHEGACDDLEGVDELQQAVDLCNLRNKDLITWTCDTKRKVRITKP